MKLFLNTIDYNTGYRMGYIAAVKGLTRRRDIDSRINAYESGFENGYKHTLDKLQK